MESIHAPVPLQVFKKPIALVACGGYHTIAVQVVDNSHVLWSWGRGDRGKISGVGVCCYQVI